MSLQQQEDSGSEAGREEAPTLNCALQQLSQVSPSRAGLPKSTAGGWEQKHLTQLVQGDL